MSINRAVWIPLVKILEAYIVRMGAGSLTGVRVYDYGCAGPNGWGWRNKGQTSKFADLRLKIHRSNHSRSIKIIVKKNRVKVK